MAFRFQKASCIAVGTFNIYIIQPAWLARPEIAIIPGGTEVVVETQLDAPGFRFSSPRSPITWTVTPSRIALETADPTCDCGETMARLIRSLPWTPLVALGNNAVFHGAPEDVVAARLEWADRLAAKPPDGFELTQRTAHIALKRGDWVMNLQMTVRDDDVELSANAHTDLRNRDARFAEEAAKRHIEDRRIAETMIADVFKVRTE